MHCQRVHKQQGGGGVFLSVKKVEGGNRGPRFEASKRDGQMHIYELEAGWGERNQEQDGRE